jgi:hypothetical protein
MMTALYSVRQDKTVAAAAAARWNTGNVVNQEYKYAYITFITYITYITFITYTQLTFRQAT